jgi:serine/threonine-protein kinase RsbW
MENRSSSTPDSNGKDVRHRKVLASQHHHVDTVVTWLEELARAEGVTDDLLHRLLVAVSEAVTNSLCHGNQLNPVRDVVVEVVFREGTVDVTVEDEGIGFQPGEVDDPLAEENLLKEGGRGVYLIEELTDEVMFEDNGRRVCMQFSR